MFLCNVTETNKMSKDTSKFHINFLFVCVMLVLKMIVEDVLYLHFRDPVIEGTVEL